MSDLIEGTDDNGEDGITHLVFIGTAIGVILAIGATLVDPAPGNVDREILGAVGTHGDHEGR